MYFILLKLVKPQYNRYFARDWGLGMNDRENCQLELQANIRYRRLKKTINTAATIRQNFYRK